MNADRTTDLILSATAFDVNGITYDKLFYQPKQ